MMANGSQSTHEGEKVEPEASPAPEKSRRSLHNETILNGTTEDGPSDDVPMEDGGQQMEDTEEEEDLPVVMTYKIILPDDEGVNDTTIRSATIFVLLVFVHMFIPLPFVMCIYTIQGCIYHALVVLYPVSNTQLLKLFPMYCLK